jgi:hypothetical protein
MTAQLTAPLTTPRTTAVNRLLPICIVSGVLVACLPVLEALLPPAHRLRPCLPSGVALAIGLYVTVSELETIIYRPAPPD